MDFLGIGPFEIVLIIILAFLFFGPEKLPEIAAKAGKLYRNLKQTTSDITREISEEISAEKTSIAEDLSDEKTSLTKDISNLGKTISENISPDSERGHLKRPGIPGVDSSTNSKKTGETGTKPESNEGVHE